MKHPDLLLVLAPHGRDAQVIIAQLTAAGMAAMAAAPAEIIAAIVDGSLGAAIVADEAMAAMDLAALAAALAAQPTWSDMPFLLLTRHESHGWSRARITALLGNVTMLERPLSPDALVSAARSALRARARQRHAEAYLLAREKAEGQIRDLAASLESRVVRRTRALSRAQAARAVIEGKLRDSEADYRFTVELSRQIPWSADGDGAIVSIGQRWFDATGASLATSIGDGWLDFAHPDDLANLAVAWRRAVAAKSPFECDFRLRVAVGGCCWYRARASPRLAADGQVLRWYGTLEDIDARRQAEARLVESRVELANVSRLSAMGTMASSLAHELNQPLTAITNYVRGSRRLLAGRDGVAPVLDALAEADRSAVRAAEIIRRVCAFVERGEVQLCPENLAALVTEAMRLARTDPASDGIAYGVDLDPRLTDVLVDRIQIQQVLVNLLRNAMESLALHPASNPARRIGIATAPASDGRCEVMVCDNGPGVPTAIASRLFDTFNTSKADGMGMGLSICRTIIEAHGGRIWHRTAPDGGAMFAFTLLLMKKSRPVQRSAARIGTVG